MSTLLAKMEADVTRITKLSKGHTSRNEEEQILSIFKEWKGADLTRLKKAIDRGGDYRDLQQLVFHDIDDRDIRKQLLDHFAEEGADARTGLTKFPVNVFSDIDDTFYLNWVDDRYPKQTVYPGVRQFYTELDNGGATEEDPLGDLIFLSARPNDRFGRDEAHVFATLKSRGVNNPTVLLGDFPSFVLGLVEDEPIAGVKFENWKQQRSLFPEYDSVLIGDSGQGDAIFGMRALDELNNNVKAVFIHKVTNLEDKGVKEAKRLAFADKRIHFFDTYVGAATEAFKRNLITREGLQRIAAAAQDELAKVPFLPGQQREEREKQLAEDLKGMDAALAL